MSKIFPVFIWNVYIEFMLIYKKSIVGNEKSYKFKKEKLIGTNLEKYNVLIAKHNCKEKYYLQTIYNISKDCDIDRINLVSNYHKRAYDVDKYSKTIYSYDSFLDCVNHLFLLRDTKKFTTYKDGRLCDANDIPNI